MCTPADDDILICGTVIGSILLFDLQEIEDAKQDDIDYSSLVEVAEEDLKY